jgi:succinate dehydrogenase/fumarate reductase flavoprotein subunit
LTRCLETLNLFDIGEMVMIAANERKETRGLHRRSDYPLTDPLLDGRGLFMKKENGELVMEFKEAE